MLQASRAPMTALIVSLLALPVAILLVKARPAGVPELALLPVQLGLLLTAAFSGQDILTLAGMAALTCTLALTLCRR